MRIIITAVFLICSFNAIAQQYLIVKKRQHTKLVFESGDYIKFRVKGEKHWRKQLIVGFLENGIRFHYFDVLLEDIEAVKRPKSSLKAGAANTLIWAGVGYLIIDQFNQFVIRDEPVDVNESTWIVSGTLVGIGVLWKLLMRKKYMIDGMKFRLETVDYVP